ncbi:MAG: DUF2293 domain-containing protein [Spirochaetales bacterium]|nr:DUF2293 domain-containing protein [Spirochaetales bacterium]
MQERSEILVFVTFKDEVCAECKDPLVRGDFVFFTKENKVICLSCADLSHLIFLPSGNAALSRRAKKYSTLYALVLKFNRRRRRNERQGLLIEKEALERAEEECLADNDKREIRRQREQKRRKIRDNEYIKIFAQKIRELYPSIPKEREYLIADHACEKYSGRVGRTSSAKELDAHAITLAVIAHIRHSETGYDRLMIMGMERHEARGMVKDRIEAVLEEWRRPRVQ